MPVTIAFGPTGQYLIDTPKKWDWSGAPLEMSERKDVTKDINCASFGANGTWILCFECKQPTGCRLSSNDHTWHISASDNFDSAFGTLWTWLQGAKGSFSDSYVSLSPSKHFFARVNNAYRFELPQITFPEINQMTDEASTVTNAMLGMNSSGVAWQTDGGLFWWGLEDNYPSLLTLIKCRKILGHPEGKFLYVSLNAFQKDEFFVLYENGEARWKVSRAYGDTVGEFMNVYQVQA